MSAIVVLVFACVGFGYSSMTNKARALKAEAELASLQKVVDANLSKKTASGSERRRSSNSQSTTGSATVNIPSPEPAADVSSDANPNQNRGRGFSMEKLKETDPERYANILEGRKKMHENSTKQVEFFKKLDTKSMTPEQLENHNKLMPLVNKNNQLLYELGQNPETENFTEIMREFGENSRQMRDLLGTERSVALQQFAKQIGYRSDQVAQFEAYVKSVYDMTSGNPYQGAFPGWFRGGNNRGQDQSGR